MTDEHGTSVVVLGATGYLGQAVVTAIQRQIGTSPVIRARGLGDLASRGVVLRSGQVVVNCVGYYGTDTDLLYDANVQHATRVATAVRAAGAALVHVSSSAVFDGVAAGRIDETMDPRPRSAYGQTKAEGEARVVELVPATRIVRPAKLFGGVDPRRRLHALLSHVRRGLPLPIPDQPSLFANFVWIADAADVLARSALEANHRGMTHLATPLPLGRFASLLGEVVHTQIRRLPRPAERALQLSAAVLEGSSHELPRGLERLVELWDRREFVDSWDLFPSDSLRRGLSELASLPE